jgi:hypothetical protein
MSGTGSVTVVIASAAAIVPLYACDAVTLLPSVAVIVKLYEPDAPGVPVIAPVDALSDNPFGSDPAVTAKVTGAVPPLVDTVWLYDVLMSGVGNVLVVIVSDAAIVPVYSFVAVTELASVAVIVKSYAPAADGVPVIAPVDVSSESPVGSDPAVTAKVTGAVPPLVGIVWLYDVLMSGVGNVLVVIVSDAAIVPVYSFVAVTELASVAVTVKSYAPAADGVPLIAPVVEPKDRPVGSAPALTENAIGAVPPLVATVSLYEALMSGVGNVAVVIDSVDAIVPVYSLVAVTELASVAVIVKSYAPAADGVPLIAPVVEFNDKPVGNAPALTENATGAVPPLVATV